MEKIEEIEEIERKQKEKEKENTDDVAIVLSQAPESVTREAAEEALTISAGNIAEAISLLWDASKPAPPTSITDPTQAKWASVREIADSICSAYVHHRDR